MPISTVVPLKDVARECRLSVSHFSRAFRRTVGVAPHHWLVTRRIEVAKEKLRNTRLSLSDVALACGFADQSHLTRVFTGRVGVSPGAWRRALDGLQAEEAAMQPFKRRLVTHLLSNCLGAFNARSTFGPYTHSIHVTIVKFKIVFFKTIANVLIAAQASHFKQD